MMKGLKILVVAILLISLFINIRLLSRITDVENSMHSISNYQMQIMDSVRGQTSNMNNLITNFKNEQSWISPIRMDTETKNLDKSIATLNFEWQIKELPNNSEVVFHYKLDED